MKSIIEAIYNHSTTTPNKVCLIDKNEAITYGDFWTRIINLSSYFKGIGICEGTCVILENDQSIKTLNAIFSLQLLKAISVPVENKCGVEKMESFASRCNSELVISDNENVRMKRISYKEIEQASQEHAMIDYEFPNEDDVCEILFSTGTTGKEKGIVLTNKNNVALAQNVMDGVKMEEDNIEMIPSPLNHSHGLRRTYANLYRGSTVVLEDGVMNVKKLFADLRDYQVNAMDLVPAALSVLLKMSKDRFAEFDSQLRYIQFGASPLMKSDKDKIKSLLPNVNLYNFYGSTESGCTCIYNFNVENEKQSCIGKPVINASIEILKDNVIIDSNKNHTGQLICKGNMNMLKYLNDEEETNKVCWNDYFVTNDEAFIDEDGDIILLGRMNDVINVGGNKVSPEEIEDVVRGFQGIINCACVPEKHPVLGQIPKLIIQTENNKEIDKKELLLYISNKVEPYKVPKNIEYIEKIPVSFNGKIQRSKLINK
ncbi:MAG: acyl--CoA ligase [Solobacterium sp.]|nr:acyl--CoA ligase [Solobacterium sp.]